MQTYKVYSVVEKIGKYFGDDVDKRLRLLGATM